MSGRRGLWTALVALGLAAAGFAAGAGGSAWQRRDRDAAPWRAMHVEHRGAEGTTTQTRVVFEDPKLALQAVEVIRSPDGAAELAHVALRDGSELTVRHGDGGRPSSLEGSDGSRADFVYQGTRARVTFFAASGAPLGERDLSVPLELRAPLRLAQAEPSRPAELWDRMTGALIAGAWAQDAAAAAEDEPVTVRRDLRLRLVVRTPDAKDAEAGQAQLEASCAPFACVPVTPELAAPGDSTVRIAVTGSMPRSKLAKPTGAALAPFQKTARDERAVARGALPLVTSVVAAVGVTASACRSIRLASSICVPELTKTAAAGAIHAVAAHDVATEGRIVDQRAEQLYYEEQARALLDAETSIQVCLSKKGHTRACVHVNGRPLGPQPMAATGRALDLRRGIGGDLEGSYVLTQSDGPDCRFSPSPRTEGPLIMRFDNERHTISLSLRANERGTRPNLRCSLGTANMTWSQSYNLNATQSVAAAALQAGGTLPIRLTGTMNGTGSYSFSNCRSSGGASANCPAGRSEGYSYPVEVTGTIDLDDQTGSGSIIVRAPLSTSGSWRIPAEAKR